MSSVFPFFTGLFFFTLKQTSTITLRFHQARTLNIIKASLKSFLVVEENPLLGLYVKPTSQVGHIRKIEILLKYDAEPVLPALGKFP